MFIFGAAVSSLQTNILVIIFITTLLSHKHCGKTLETGETVMMMISVEQTSLVNPLVNYH